MAIILISDYINNHIQNQGMNATEVANKLKMSKSMISEYRKNRFLASIDVAMLVYMLDGVVLHPFSEESLKHEIMRGKFYDTWWNSL